MSKSVDVALWNILSRKSCLTFGRECGSVIIWAIFSLTMRTILVLLRIENYVPRGFIFAFPLLMQFIVQFLPPIFHAVPLLSVRLAQSLVGKSNPMNILVLIPAHLLGAVIGLVCFRTVFPFLPNQVYEPIAYQPSSTSWMLNLTLEALYSFCYVSVMLVLPYMLQINRISKVYLSLPMVPLFLGPCPGQTSAFNPAMVYALWIVGPLVGATVAAMVCSVFFPDDTASWKRNPHCL